MANKVNFRDPRDEAGGFFLAPNHLDDVVLNNGTEGLQRVLANNQAAGIGPHILTGLDVSGTTVQAGAAVFKSGGIVETLATTLATIGGSGNYLYLDNSGNFTREATLQKSDTKLLIDYLDGSTWYCTKEASGQLRLNHNIELVESQLSIKDLSGTGKETTIDTTSGIVTDHADITTGHISTLDAAMAAGGNNITGVGNLTTTTETVTGVLTASGGITSLPAPASGSTSPIRAYDISGWYGIVEFRAMASSTNDYPTLAEAGYMSVAGSGTYMYYAYINASLKDQTVVWTARIPYDYKSNYVNTFGSINTWYIYSLAASGGTPTYYYTGTWAQVIAELDANPSRYRGGYIRSAGATVGTGATNLGPILHYNKLP